MISEIGTSDKLVRLREQFVAGGISKLESIRDAVTADFDKGR